MIASSPSLPASAAPSVSLRVRGGVILPGRAVVTRPSASLGIQELSMLPLPVPLSHQSECIT
jgi:hypothetical protein